MWNHRDSSMQTIFGQTFSGTLYSLLHLFNVSWKIKYFPSISTTPECIKTVFLFFLFFNSIYYPISFLPLQRSIVAFIINISSVSYNNRRAIKKELGREHNSQLFFHNNTLLLKISCNFFYL